MATIVVGLHPVQPLGPGAGDGQRQVDPGERLQGPALPGDLGGRREGALEGVGAVERQPGREQEDRQGSEGPQGAGEGAPGQRHERVDRDQEHRGELGGLGEPEDRPGDRRAPTIGPLQGPHPGPGRGQDEEGGGGVGGHQGAVGHQVRVPGHQGGGTEGDRRGRGSAPAGPPMDQEHGAQQPAELGQPGQPPAQPWIGPLRQQPGQGIEHADRHLGVVEAGPVPLLEDPAAHLEVVGLVEGRGPVPGGGGPEGHGQDPDHDQGAAGVHSGRPYRVSLDTHLA